MKKLNWGTKLVIAMGSFIAFLLVLLTVVVNNRQEIVVDDYYPRDLKHQELINRRQNLANLKDAVSIAVTDAGLQVGLPSELSKKPTHGKIWFYSPSNRDSDFELLLAPDSNGHQLIPRQLFQQSRYIVKMTWETASVPYYYEQEISIN